MISRALKYGLLLLQLCPSPLLHLSPTAPLPYCTSPLLRLSPTAPLPYCPSPLLHLSPTAPLPYCTSPLLHLSPTAPLPYSTCHYFASVYYCECKQKVSMTRGLGARLSYKIKSEQLLRFRATGISVSGHKHHKLRATYLNFTTIL